VVVDAQTDRRRTATLVSATTDSGADGHVGHQLTDARDAGRFFQDMAFEEVQNSNMRALSKSHPRPVGSIAQAHRSITCAGERRPIVRGGQRNAGWPRAARPHAVLCGSQLFYIQNRERDEDIANRGVRYSRSGTWSLVGNSARVCVANNLPVSDFQYPSDICRS
jgi:hypothetical protein